MSCQALVFIPKTDDRFITLLTACHFFQKAIQAIIAHYYKTDDLDMSAALRRKHKLVARFDRNYESEADKQVGDVELQYVGWEEVLENVTCISLVEELGGCCIF